MFRVPSAPRTANRLGNYYGVGGSGFDSANAVIAAATISLVYFIAVLIFLFLFAESILISVMVDTICLGFLWIFILGKRTSRRRDVVAFGVTAFGVTAESRIGSVAALSVHASVFSNCDATVCSLGSATIGLGWVLWFLVFGLLAFEVTYTLLHYGTSYPTWRTPFAQLVVYGSKASGPASGGIGHNAETGAVTTGGPVYAGPGRTGGSEAVPMSNVGAPATAATASTQVPAAPSHTQIEEPAHVAATPAVHA
ncbi:hypothetical protein JCM24511_07430 [Saitozyma sp. JCM 24511]|nr:hypothetical protein JCM24511_07430 [Saitozyma sp. JCM 24511]